VLIPAANVKHLMLRGDVVAAAEAHKFRIFAVDNVDQAVALLTGVPAGQADAAGQYPEGSINHKVAGRLTELTTLRKQFAQKTDSKPETKKDPE